jgi:thiosulfate/3-mercaptopyruvate sulfurtransferase
MNFTGHPGAIIALFIFAFSVSPAFADVDAKVLSYVDDAGPLLNKGVRVIDSRPSDACQKQSLAGTRCLPAGDFLGPHGRLAAWPDIFWLLGAAGLEGGEHVLVVGDAPVLRDFVAGILFIAGQRRVSILTAPLTAGRKGEAKLSGPGEARAQTRLSVYRAKPRGKPLMLRSELSAAISTGANPPILDGRDEAEYWGKLVRASRGGHIPGADHLPASRLRADIRRGRKGGPAAGPIVVYGHGPVDGIAYLTLVRAGLGLDASVYPGGWSEWAAYGKLPADAATYPIAASEGEKEPAPFWQTFGPVIAVGALLWAAGMTGYILGRKRQNRNQGTA